MQNIRSQRIARVSKPNKNIILNHIQRNIREYCIVGIIFIVGVLIGVVFINNLSDNQYHEINEYINTFINSIKNEGNIKEGIILKNSIINNVFFGIILWIFGSTIIGLIIVYICICFKGFCLGYTISTFISVLGLKNGIIFSMSTMLLQSFITIPCIIAIGVSGTRLYNAIMQDRRADKIKSELCRHTIFSAFMLSLLIVSSILETYISKNILIYILEYI